MNIKTMLKSWSNKTYKYSFGNKLIELHIMMNSEWVDLEVRRNNMMKSVFY